jgi:hypothetical protein
MYPFYNIPVLDIEISAISGRVSSLPAESSLEPRESTALGNDVAFGDIFFMVSA